MIIKFFKKLEKYFYIVFSYTLLPTLVLAAPQGGNPGEINNPLMNANSIKQLIERLIDVVLELGVILAALAVMYGGYKLVTASGNPEEIEGARKMITWALVGTAVLLGARVIVKVITGTLGEINNAI